MGVNFFHSQQKDNKNFQTTQDSSSFGPSFNVLSQSPSTEPISFGKKSTPRRPRSYSGNSPKRCVECNRSDTPMWRSGPMGPSTLCNACGVRYRNMLKKEGKRSIFGESARSESRSAKTINSHVEHPSPERYVFNHLTRRCPSISCLCVDFP